MPQCHLSLYIISVMYLWYNGIFFRNKYVHDVCSTCVPRIWLSALKGCILRYVLKDTLCFKGSHFTDEATQGLKVKVKEKSLPTL